MTGISYSNSTEDRGLKKSHCSAKNFKIKQNDTEYLAQKN